jgi:hypothetical protein
MSDNAKPREPAWIARLSKMGAAAESRRSKLKGTFGAGNTGRSVTSWSCTCGWQGEARELRLQPRTAALACPSCGEAGGLKARGP